MKKTVHPILHKDLKLSKKRRGGAQTVRQGDEEGASQDLRCVHGDVRHGSLTILGNIFTVDESVHIG
jgi:hypothetical protein